MTKNERAPIYFLFIVLLIGLLAIIVEPGLIQADSTLPPRKLPTVTPQEDNKDDSGGKNPPAGAYIELQLQPAQAGVWTVVQWQDSAGGWQKVEGWQGPPEGSGRRWWVAAKDFGAGTFRWAITQGPGGKLLGVSQTFNLPSSPNEIVRVSVSLTP